MFVAGRGGCCAGWVCFNERKIRSLATPIRPRPIDTPAPNPALPPRTIVLAAYPAHGLRSYSSKYFKVFSEGFMAFWNLGKAARLHAACPHGWPRTDKIRLSRRAPMQPALGVAPAASRLPFLPDAGTYRRRAGSRATPKGCICSPKYEEALCHHEGPSGPGATSCRVPKGNRVSPLRCQT